MFPRTVLATVLSIGLLAPAAFAQAPQAPGAQGPEGQRARSIHLRQQQQVKRIQTGRERGVIDPAEFRKLMGIQRAIRAETQRLRQSGDGLTMRERLRIHRDLNRSSRAIRRAVRGGPGGSAGPGGPGGPGGGR